MRKISIMNKKIDGLNVLHLKSIQCHSQIMRIRHRLMEPLTNEDGLGIVEIALIIIIIIGLAFMFKEKVEVLLEELFGAMEYSEFME